MIISSHCLPKFTRVQKDVLKDQEQKPAVIDERVVARILQEVKQWDEPVRIAILPDHPTPIKFRTHTTMPVPFVIWQSKPSKAGDPVDIIADEVMCYDEDAAAKGALGLMKDDEFIRFFLGETKPVPSTKRMVK